MGGIISLPLIIIVLNLGDIFNFFLDSIGISIYCRRVVAITISLAILVLTTFLVLIFFASLTLVGRRLLMFATRYVSERSVSRFSLSKVFILLFCGPVPSETLRVYLAGA